VKLPGPKLPCCKTVTIRKTESRIPANFQASDLGEASVATDGRSALISFVTSPLVVGRENVYVLFVTDAGLAVAAQSFEWTFTENGGTPETQTTQRGEVSYSPRTAGELNLVVRILGAGNTEQATLALAQQIASPNVELETLISGARNEPGPGVSNPDVARELINDHNPYYQDVALQTPETGDGFQRFVFGTVFDGALRRTAAARKQHLNELAASLNNQSADFVTLVGKGAGVCGIRLALLAMILPAFLDFTELPEPFDQRALADEQLSQTLAALDEEKRIDLFNLVRFPKSNIARCAGILEALRDRYFPGTNFNDVLTGLSGTRAHWIIRHFKEGPLVRT
jgi:hypothetical protein